MGQADSAGARALRGLALGLAIGAAALAAPRASAQIIDQIDVVKRGEDAVVLVRFATSVQYLRHAPPDRGKLVQIDFQITGRLDGTLRNQRQTHRYPKTDLAPAFLLSYTPLTSGLTVEFREEVRFAVRGGADGRSLEIAIGRNGKPPAAAPPPAAAAKPSAPPAAPKPAAEPKPPVATLPPAPPPGAPAPPATTPPSAVAPGEGPPGVAIAPPAAGDLEAESERLLATARAALERKDHAAAIEALNRVLGFPPNRHSQEAQEMIGRARELDGDVRRARVEYELYLKLYPVGEGAERVKSRLAGLREPTPAELRGEVVAKPETSVYGSVSAYYYNGNSKFDSTLAPPTPGLPGDQISLTSKDQDSLVTNLDLTARYRSGAWDNRLVLRDTFTANFLSGEADDNRLYNLYYEFGNRGLDLIGRLGRQSSPGVGVLGRFDGAWVRSAFRPGWRLGAVGGRPVEFFPSPDKQFAGASLDVGPFSRAWSGNVFAIEQRVDGFTDRRGTGLELRYLDPTVNGFAILDYDLRFKEMNIALVQANWNLKSGASVNLLYDRRRTPPLQLTNALTAYPQFHTVREIMDSGVSYDQLLSDAKAVTPISDLVSLGGTWPLTPRWQLGGDVKLQRVSATQDAGSLPGSPGTGDIWIYTGQAIGTSILKASDVLVLGGSVIRGTQFDGWTLSGSYVLVFLERWRFETQLKYYVQDDANGVTLKRFTPTLKLAWRVRDNFTFESEAGWERSDSTGPQSTDLTDRRFWNVGLRWDFY